MNQRILAVLAFTFVFAIAHDLSAAEPAWTSITVKEMHCAGCAKKIAARLYAVRGVQEVRVDVETKTLFVAPQQSKQLSPLEIWEAVEKAKNLPIRLAGPGGIFTEKPNF